MSDTHEKEKISPQYLLLGEVLRPHGIRGELRMKIHTDYPERINTLESVYLARTPDEANPQPYAVQHLRMHKNYGLLKLDGIDYRDQADRLRELFVMVHIDDAVPLEEDEIYLYQLISLTVKTEDGAILGNIIDVLETGANDVYIIKSANNGEILFPATTDNILETNLEDKFILVKIPDGLLPDK